MYMQFSNNEEMALDPCKTTANKFFDMTTSMTASKTADLTLRSKQVLNNRKSDSNHQYGQQSGWTKDSSATFVELHTCYALPETHLCAQRHL